ncbi:TBC1 domain family member 14-like isoform X2 [Ptychodera flava]|uniref:TBC1 domain family member 14-like isoform X2 n=1 Tax=Ptychodera flava TaxID=63121 RepID=UPI003969E2BF
MRKLPKNVKNEDDLFGKNYSDVAELEEGQETGPHNLKGKNARFVGILEEMNSVDCHSKVLVASPDDEKQDISEAEAKDQESIARSVEECSLNVDSDSAKAYDTDSSNNALANMTLKTKELPIAEEPLCNSNTCNDEINTSTAEEERREHRRVYEASFRGNCVDNENCEPTESVETPVKNATNRPQEPVQSTGDNDEGSPEDGDTEHRDPEQCNDHPQDVDDKPESERYDNFEPEQRVVEGSEPLGTKQIPIKPACQENSETPSSQDEINAREGVRENGSSSNGVDECDSDTVEETTGDASNVFTFSGQGYLPRTGTETSLQSDTSITSVSSISTEPSSGISTEEAVDGKACTIVDDTEEAGFVEVNLSTRNSFDPAHNVVNYDDQVALAQGAKPKKKGLSGFLSRTLFTKKASAKELPVQPSSPPGWKLFGRVPSKESIARPPAYISEEYQAKGKTHPPTTSKSWKKRASSLKVASSTTALILENRPHNLPAKSPEEEQKHKQQYEEMVQNAKKKEFKDAKRQLKKMAEQVKIEEHIATNLITWNAEILPNWETAKNSKKARDLWWGGVPPGARGKVWLLAIGNELNITHELFEIFKARAKSLIKALSGSDSESEEVHAASKESSVEVIKLDVNRTFPQLCIFQKGGPYHDMLGSILGAYACYRPDVGYVQGMSFIAAVFLLNLEPADAFICFANLLNKSCQLSFFRLDELIMKAYFATYEEYFEDNLPELFKHFKELNVTPDLYIIDWMYTIYSKSLPLDVACRVWDVFFRDGEEFLFRTALGILHMYQEILLNMDFIHIAQFLTKLPEDIVAEELFASIAAISTQQKKFSQVFMSHLNTVQNANSKD